MFNNNDLLFPLPSDDNGENEQPEPIDTYYRISSDNLEFQLLYRIMGSRKGCYIIDKQGKECGAIYVDENEDDEENETRELVMVKVAYKPQCSIGRQMVRGESTIKMIKLLLCFTIKMIPSFDYISFMDDSYIDCVLPNNTHYTHISIAYLYFIMYGQTWYENHFGAVLFEEEGWRRSQLNDANVRLESKMTQTPFKQFWKTYIRTGDNLGRQKWYKQIKVHIKNLYQKHLDEGSSWRTFFKDLFGKQGACSRFSGEYVCCTLFKMALPTILGLFGIPELYQSHWKIARETIMSYSEYAVEASHNANPIHNKKSETDAKMHFMKTHTNAVYEIGVTEGGTRRNKYKKFPSLGYGGIVGFLNDHPRGKTRRRRF